MQEKWSKTNCRVKHGKMHRCQIDPGNFNSGQQRNACTIWALNFFCDYSHTDTVHSDFSNNILFSALQKREMKLNS